MKKIYNKPMIEIVGGGCHLMQGEGQLNLGSIKIKGNIGNGETEIGWGGYGEDEDEAGAKSGNLWEGWDD